LIISCIMKRIHFIKKSPLLFIFHVDSFGLLATV